MRRLRRFGFGPVSLLTMSIILPPASEAANLAVTLFTDTNSGGLAGTGAGAAGDLRAAILAANASAGADTITFACGSPPCTITLTGPLPPITESLTIDGGTLGNIVVSGANAYRVFFVDTGAVTIRNLVIQNGLAQGGAGGTGDGGGGGGAGLGAGLFVNQAGANVSLTNVRFLNSSAVGGAGGTFFGTCCGGGGGGGMAFPGGATIVNGGGTGGGGMLGPGGNAPNLNGGAGGAGGGGGGGRHVVGTAGAGSTGYATNTGGAAGVLAAGGAGGFGGGGGGAPVGAGGNGGFGGGGGGTGANTQAGNGGPGGGGGGADGGTSANRGSGGSLGSGVSGGNAGTGSGSGGGGGAAAGPAVFVNAGSLTISNSTAIGSTATPGAGGTGQSGHNGSAGTSNATSLFNYAGMVNSSTATGPLTLLEPPTVTSVSPGSGPTSGGNTVTITGTNFTGAISVMFEGTAATSFTVASATTITAIVPAHAAGSVNVVVTTPGGSNPANTLYTYNRMASAISVTAPGSLTYGASGNAMASVSGSTGAVTFTAAGGGCSVRGATVSVTNASLPCNLTATVAADNYYNGAASAAFSVTLNKAALTVTAQNATKVFGARLPTFTPTITGFINGDTQAVVTGAPSLTTTATTTSPVNTYPITATVGTLAAANYTFTTFVNGTLSITKASTTTQLATQSGSLVATITPVSPGAGSPTGTVQFLNDATVFATVPLSGPTASTPAPRSGMMTAIYSGDAAFTGSNSAALVIYPPLTTSLSLTSDLRPSTIGSVVIFTALISTTGGAPGAGAAITGTVQFFDGSSLLGTANVSNNQASFSTAALSAGTHLITARYTGSAPNAEEAITQTVNALATRMTLAANPINAMYGQPVTLSANVGPTTAPPGFAPPSGQVTFLQESGTPMGQGTPLGAVNLVSGTATFTVNNLSVGTHYLAAKYGGDSTWAARSSEVVVTVAPASTVTSVSLALVGGQLVLTGVTAPVAPAAGTPTGNVNFVDQANNTTVASGVLSGGKAAASMATSAASTLLGRPIAAVYAGDTNFQSSTSASLPVVVNAASDLPSSLASDEICSIFGVTGMQGDTAATLALTASLGGVTVTLTDSAGTSRPAQLYGAFASARQINFLAPGGLANGMATLSIALPGGGTQSTVVNIANTSPGIFAASMNGQGVYAGQAAYVHSDGTQTVASSTNPVNLGTPGDRVYLILYGTGLRQAAAVSVMMNGVSVPVTYFGAQRSYAGVDQINVGPLPASLAGAGTINLVVAADGVAANPVTVTIQ